MSKCVENHSTCLSWHLGVNGENRFALSLVVSEKMDVKVKFRIGPNFKFYAAVALLC